MNKLAQAIILQSVEDLWDRRHMAGSVEFFSGEGFHICAQMAGLGPKEKFKMLDLAWKVLRLSDSQELAGVGKRNAVATNKTPVMTF